MYATTETCSMMQSALTVFTSSAYSPHPLTLSALPGMLKTFNHLQQMQVHIHSFNTTFPHAKHIFTLILITH